ALTLLGSHPQLAIVALAPPALYAAWRLVRGPRRAALFPLAAAGVMGAAVSAVRFLPTLPLVEASERAGGLTLDASAIGSVPPHALLAGWLFPSLQVPRYLAPQWAAYVGALPLALALAARGRGGLLLLAGGGIVIAFGSFTPVFWLIQRTPLLTYFREPSRFLLWTVLAVALLAAAGLDRVRATRPDGAVRAVGRVLVFGLMPVVGAIAVSLTLRHYEPRLVPWIYLNTVGEVRQRDYPQEHYASLAARTWLTARRSVDMTDPGLAVPLVSLVLAAGWWAVLRTRSSGAIAALACAGIPLLAYGQVRLPAVPRNVAAETPAAVAMGESSASAPGRVLSWLPLAADFENRVQLEGAGLDADVASYRLLKRLLAPNFALQHGIAQLDGYENLMTREQATLTAALGSERTSSASELALVRQRLPERRRLGGERWGLAQAAGVSTLLTVERLQPSFWPAAARFDPGAARAERGLPSVTAFHLTRPAPRVYVADTWRVARSIDDAVELLADDEIDGEPSTVITFEEGGKVPAPRAAVAGGSPGSASILRYEERLVEIEASADTDALLVLLDAKTPGWRATVNDAPAEILTANVAFRAVPLPAGRHRVRFTYEPPSWGPALAISGGAAVVLLGWLGWVLRPAGGRFTRGDARPADH
ncbi:MAG TPA: YfhO family protein, partial [Chloroflexota bacterium]|nr:YfhO family protein [Chloroflexota bacterium]